MLTFLIFTVGLTTIATAVGAGAAALGKVDIDAEKNVGGYDVHLQMNEDKPFKLKVEKAE